MITVRGAAAAAKSLQLCPTLYDPIDGSPPGSSVPGILQGSILEWVAISLSKKEEGEAQKNRNCGEVGKTEEKFLNGSPLRGRYCVKSYVNRVRGEIPVQLVTNTSVFVMLIDVCFWLFCFFWNPIQSKPGESWWVEAWCSEDGVSGE